MPGLPALPPPSGEFSPGTLMRGQTAEIDVLIEGIYESLGPTYTEAELTRRPIWLTFV